MTDELYNFIDQRDPIAIEAALDYIRQMIESRDRDRWVIGDILVDLDTRYGYNDIADMAAAVGCSASSLYDYRKVAATFYGDARARIMQMDNISWSHCADAAKRVRLETLDDKLLWLECVSDNGLSVDAARHELKQRYGRADGRVRVAEYTAWFEPRTGALMLDVGDGMAMLDGDGEYTVVVYKKEISGHPENVVTL